jgi:hypothetical protein
MPPTRLQQWMRPPGVWGLLLAFALGNNYCTLAALGGDSRMTCLAVPGVKPAACATHCGRAASPWSGDARPDAASSCCPKLSPAADFSSLGTVTFATELLAPLPPATPQVSVSMVAALAAPDAHAPPGADLTTPPPARAPPAA